MQTDQTERKDEDDEAEEPDMELTELKQADDTAALGGTRLQSKWTKQLYSKCRPR